MLLFCPNKQRYFEPLMCLDSTEDLSNSGSQRGSKVNSTQVCFPLTAVEENRLNPVLVSSSSLLLYVHRDHKGYQGRGGEPRTATSTFTQLLTKYRGQHGDYLSIRIF